MISRKDYTFAFLTAYIDWDNNFHFLGISSEEGSIDFFLNFTKETSFPFPLDFSWNTLIGLMDWMLLVLPRWALCLQIGALSSPLATTKAWLPVLT